MDFSSYNCEKAPYEWRIAQGWIFKILISHFAAVGSIPDMT